MRIGPRRGDDSVRLGSIPSLSVWPPDTRFPFFCQGRRLGCGRVLDISDGGFDLEENKQPNDAEKETLPEKEVEGKTVLASESTTS